MTEELKLCEHNNYHCYRCEVKLLKFTIDELQQQNKQLISVLKQMDDRVNPMLPRSEMSRIAKEVLDQIESGE